MSDCATPRAIRFVYRDASGKFQIDEDAVSFLQQLKGPISVVSICGPARQGKSYILNQLCGSHTGFEVAPSVDPCTKGLWLWNSPIRRIAADGTEHSLLLMDSEGISQGGIYSWLVVVLSSMLIYNEMGDIGEYALGCLHPVTTMAEKDTGAAPELIGQFFPSLVWLLRDSYLDKKKITPCELLERALRPSGDTATDKIRESIRALFPSMDCFALVRPMIDENDLERLPEISMDKLRPEFRSELDEFVSFVLKKAKPKSVKDRVMTGSLFVGFAESFLDTFNAGSLPTLSSLCQAAIQRADCKPKRKRTDDAEPIGKRQAR